MTDAAAQRSSPLVRFAVIFVVVGAVLFGLFQGAEWRADNTALARYCDDPKAHIDRVVRIIEESEPVGDGERRTYIVAAKLLFLVPLGEGEKVANYRLRLLAQIEDRCP